MPNSRQQSLALPSGWADVFVRTVTVLLVAFVTLNLKEWVETREIDLLAVAIDAGCVAAATFLLYSILTLTAPPGRPTEERRL